MNLNLLSERLTPQGIERVQKSLEEECISCPLEITHIIAALEALKDSADEASIDAHADECTLIGEQHAQRSDQYDATINAIKEVWS